MSTDTACNSFEFSLHVNRVKFHGNRLLQTIRYPDSALFALGKVEEDRGVGSKFDIT